MMVSLKEEVLHRLHKGKKMGYTEKAVEGGSTSRSKNDTGLERFLT